MSLQLYLACKRVTLGVWFLNMIQEHYIILILSSIMYPMHNMGKISRVNGLGVYYENDQC